MTWDEIELGMRVEASVGGQSWIPCTVVFKLGDELRAMARSSEKSWMLAAHHTEDGSIVNAEGKPISFKKDSMPVIQIPDSDCIAIDTTEIPEGKPVVCLKCGRSQAPMDQEDLWTHLESKHHTPVVRKGESLDHALQRFASEYPEVKTCDDCAKKKAPWSLMATRVH